MVIDVKPSKQKVSVFLENWPSKRRLDGPKTVVGGGGGYKKKSSWSCSRILKPDPMAVSPVISPVVPPVVTSIHVSFLGHADIDPV